MKHQLQLFAEPAIAAGTPDRAAPAKHFFIGTDNVRHLRVISALRSGPRSRKDIDRIGGTSNGPELISKLRKRGLEIPCELVKGIDRDGGWVRFGVYAFSEMDHVAVGAWLSRQPKAVTK